MSSRLYTFSNSLAPGTVAKASDINDHLSTIEASFEATTLELNTAIKLPASESATNTRVTQAAAARQGYMLGFDAAGAFVVANKFYIDWDMDSKRLRNVPTAVAGDEPVNLTQMTAYAAGLTGLPSIAAQAGYLVTDGATTVWQSTLVQVEVNNIGHGFDNPWIVLGDATSLAAELRFRSLAGAQAYDADIWVDGGTNGTAGKGNIHLESKTVASTGPIGYESEYDAGNSGASISLDFLNGARQKLTLNNATPAITVGTTGLVVGHYQIKLVQSGATAAVPTWVGFAAADCVGNALPVVGTASNGVTFIYLYWDGAQFWVTSSSWD